jgi:hypothetical protein
VVDRIEPELIRVFCPAFADVFVGREPSQGFEPLCEIIGGQKSGEIAAELIVETCGQVAKMLSFNLLCQG